MSRNRVCLRTRLSDDAYFLLTRKPLEQALLELCESKVITDLARNMPLSVKLTDAEDAEVRAAADSVNMKVTEYVRAKLFGKPLVGRRQRELYVVPQLKDLLTSKAKEAGIPTTAYISWLCDDRP